MNSELVLFAGYSIIGQNTSRYRATIGSYLLGMENKASFSKEASKNPKGIPCFPSKMWRSLPEHLILPTILPGCFSLCSSRLSSRTCQYPIKEHLIFSVCPDFVLYRTPLIPWQKHTSEQTTTSKYEKPLYLCFIFLRLHFPLGFCRRHW